MAERATVYQVTQIGKEADKGTPVAATIQLPATSFETGIRTEIRSHRAAGTKFPGIAALGKEWVEARVSGAAAYNDLAYLLAMILRAPTTAQEGVTTAYKHTYDMANASPDAVKSFSVEQGDPAAWQAGEAKAHKWNYGLLTELGLEFSRDEISVSGTMIGRGFTVLGATMTAGTRLAERPILPTEVSIYCDDAEGGLGGTKLLRVMRASLRLSNRFGPVWTLNAAESSFAADVELVPTLTLGLTMSADSAGMGLLAPMRSGTVKYLRVEAVSTVLAGVGFPYKLTVDMPGLLTANEPFTDQDGIYAIPYTFTAAPELTGDKPVKIELTNVVTAI